MVERAFTLFHVTNWPQGKHLLKEKEREREREGVKEKSIEKGELPSQKLKPFPFSPFLILLYPFYEIDIDVV